MLFELFIKELFLCCNIKVFDTKTLLFLIATQNKFTLLQEKCKVLNKININILSIKSYMWLSNFKTTCGKYTREHYAFPSAAQHRLIDYHRF